MLDIFSLSNKTVLVTGASSGIGRSIAINCAKQGANVCLTARNGDRLNETNELTGGKCSVHIADLSSEKEIINLVDSLPVLEGIVLNAGLLKTLPVKFIKKESFDTIFSVNVASSFFLIKYLLKKKKIKEGGSICLISSVASQKMTLGNSLYSASKGAVNSFAKSLALELAPKQIRVNAILPGMIETNILDNSSISERDLEKHLGNYPLGRFGKPQDIAHLVIYLLSEASTFMTGSLIKIDGGYTLK